VPVLAVVIGALTLGESVTVWLALGAALVVVGVAVAQVRR
jgi:drug/metabolite transporter (DMT)-like permease